MWAWGVVLWVSVRLHGPRVEMGWFIKREWDILFQKKEVRMLEKEANITFPLYLKNISIFSQIFYNLKIFTHIFLWFGEPKCDFCLYSGSQQKNCYEKKCMTRCQSPYQLVLFYHHFSFKFRASNFTVNIFTYMLPITWNVIR